MNAAKHTEDLGTLSLVDGTIKYRSTFYPPWTLSVAELRLLGEYTNEDGPHAADHFLIFFGADRQAHEVPVDAGGMISTLHTLEQIFGSSVKPELRFNTSFESQVIWPPHLKGQPIFVMHEKAEKFSDKLRSALGFGRVELWLRPEITSHVEGRHD